MLWKVMLPWKILISSVNYNFFSKLDVLIEQWAILFLFLPAEVV